MNTCQSLGVYIFPCNKVSVIPWPGLRWNPKIFQENHRCFNHLERPIAHQFIRCWLRQMMQDLTSTNATPNSVDEAENADGTKVCHFARIMLFLKGMDDACHPRLRPGFPILDPIQDVDDCTNSARCHVKQIKPTKSIRPNCCTLFTRSNCC